MKLYLAIKEEQFDCLNDEFVPAEITNKRNIDIPQIVEDDGFDEGEYLIEVDLINKKQMRSKAQFIKVYFK